MRKFFERIDKITNQNEFDLESAGVVRPFRQLTFMDEQ